jgi:hypothetical protein
MHLCNLKFPHLISDTVIALLALCHTALTFPDCICMCVEIQCSVSQRETFKLVDKVFDLLISKLNENSCRTYVLFISKLYPHDLYLKGKAIPVTGRGGP